MARTFGIEVRRITLFLFGGMTQMEREADSPRAEFLVALVGPAASALLGGLALWLGLDWAGSAVARALDAGDPVALMRCEQQAFPVESRGRLLGIVRLAEVRERSSSQWQEMTVAEVMTPVSELPALPPDARAEQALDELTRRDVEQLPVVDRDHMVGLVSRGDLVKWLALRRGVRPGPGGPMPRGPIEGAASRP